MADPVIRSGRTFEIDFRSETMQASTNNFYALYEGKDFNAPERGILSVIASGHDWNSTHEAHADAVQSIVHGFAEGYFGARRTFSPKHAAFDALSAVNRWLLDQSCVSLSALLVYGRRIGLVQAGACQIYRLRGESLIPLALPHSRSSPGKFFIPTRAVGLEKNLMPDWAEEEAEAGDIYIFLAGLEAVDNVYTSLLPFLSHQQSDTPAQIILELLEKIPGINKSVMVLTLLELPTEKDQSADLKFFTTLPIRTVPREGDVIDGFQIGPVIHRGRYTVLFSAKDLENKADVAIKFPLPSILNDEIFIAGFMREAWVGSTIRSKVVIKYIELAAERQHSLYLVMPLYHGETLEKRLSRMPMVNLVEGIEISTKLCEAVQDLAAIEIVHRDLKPENVILLDTGEVKLLDLGLAYLPWLDTESAMGPGGTIRYMAPELLKGKPANARTEVYSLAIMFYRIFSAGAFPHGQREKYPLQRLRPDLPPWLGMAFARGFSTNPEDRFPNAGEFATALYTGLREGKDVIDPRRKSILNNIRIWQASTVFFFSLSVFLLLRFV